MENEYVGYHNVDRIQEEVEMNLLLFSSLAPKNFEEVKNLINLIQQSDIQYIPNNKFVLHWNNREIYFEIRKMNSPAKRYFHLWDETPLKH